MEKCINNVSVGIKTYEDSKSNKNVIRKDLKGDNFFENYLNAIGRDKKELEEKNEVENAVKRLGDSFGVSTNFMYAILKSLYIEPEDLLDESKQELIMKKLELYFGVTKKKEEALNEIISIKKRE